MNEGNKIHWQNIYTNKQPNEVSWTQLIPQSSLDYINSFKLFRTASIIDVGGGESHLIDYLLRDGYTNISVLDISSMALVKTKNRLGKHAGNVKWIEADIINFNPAEDYDVWHDRAVFHFLTSPVEKEKYISIVNANVKEYLVMATFSTDGPLKCSGLAIQQYTAASLQELFKENFILIFTKTEDHITPFNTKQNFLWCVFRRIKK